eukprot:322698-Karenia_brevis.AAC.1
MGIIVDRVKGDALDVAEDPMNKFLVVCGDLNLENADIGRLNVSGSVYFDDGGSSNISCSDKLLQDCCDDLTETCGDKCTHYSHCTKFENCID